MTLTESTLLPFGVPDLAGERELPLCELLFFFFDNGSLFVGDTFRGTGESALRATEEPFFADAALFENGLFIDFGVRFVTLLELSARLLTGVGVYVFGVLAARRLLIRLLRVL